MPQFAYYGRNANREPVEGRIEAASVANVVDTLTQTGITPVSITEVPQVQQASEVISRLLGSDKVSALELLMFTRQFYTLTKAGVPIIRALRSLEVSTQQKALKKLYAELAQALESGVELSQAMSRREDVFDPFYIAMVRIGESAGRMEEVFLGLFEHLEFQKYIKEQVKSALRYPTFVVLAMVVAIAIINIFVIPAFAKVFESLHAELPLMTRILMATSQFTLKWWPAVVGGAVLAWLGWRQYLKTTLGRLRWDRTKLRMPIVGDLVEKGVLAQGMRSLALVFRSGVPVVQGLSLSAQVIDNAHISQALVVMRSQVERGDSLLTASQRSGVFPPLVLQMIMVGEESGTLGEMLEEIGQMYQRDMEYGLKGLSQKIEPILLVLMGAMVLVLALGVFLPMWDLGKAAIK
ncbi:type II secretion system F family protein [Aquabacterium sp.]|uniref:type II secretion system F family protein n=1 Tax=Aquabacterium sp. TaxID=1872578 RepID=UPI002E31CF66|nr:type II secretion system F family protein [Aquabacterium sp.]HEX5311629.1 type II secretion system F family protein [Aquabacterium sp.]